MQISEQNSKWNIIIFKKIEKYAKNYFILSSFKSERNKLFCVSMTMIFDI
jgi:hypothetical protein